MSTHPDGIYLDYAATTPLDPRVAEAMMECLQPGGAHGNPASVNHEFGRRARALVERARATRIFARWTCTKPRSAFTT